VQPESASVKREAKKNRFIEKDKGFMSISIADRRKVVDKTILFCYFVQFGRIPCRQRSLMNRHDYNMPSFEMNKNDTIPMIGGWGDTLSLMGGLSVPILGAFIMMILPRAAQAAICVVGMGIILLIVGIYVLNDTYQEVLAFYEEIKLNRQS